MREVRPEVNARKGRAKESDRGGEMKWTRLAGRLAVPLPLVPLSKWRGSPGGGWGQGRRGKGNASTMDNSWLLKNIDAPR